MSAIICAENMSKKYGNKTVLDEVSFTIEKGSIVGLIGSNGAGKTTTLKALLGLIDFDGELDVLGVDPRKDRKQLMNEVCFISDVGVLPKWIKVSEALDFIEGVHPRFNRKRAEVLLSETEISLDLKVKQLSKGMVTQLHLSLVLAIDVKLLILDEPTLGLDIIYQKAFFDRILNDYFDHETSVLISTHQVEELKSIMSHLIFIDHGKIILDCSIDEIDEKYCEVMVEPSQLVKARMMNPIHTRELLGFKGMLFENTNKNQLRGLGEICKPSISDLFVAKTQMVRL